MYHLKWCPLSETVRLPKMINDQGGQIRIFMPRYGNINERRHQPHEVNFREQFSRHKISNQTNFYQW
jgi:glycogen synthase